MIAGVWTTRHHKEGLAESNIIYDSSKTRAPLKLGLLAGTCVIRVGRLLFLETSCSACHNFVQWQNKYFSRTPHCWKKAKSPPSASVREDVRREE
jgi:hypothetical protein